MMRSNYTLMCCAGLLVHLTGSVAAAQSSQAGADSLEEVTVSTTRITRSDFVAPTPQSTITAEELDTRGVTSIGTYLQALPAINTVNPNASTGAATSGIASADLRGLGSNRTLVLVNGRRMVSSTENGVVDLATIPSVSIGELQLVTGGASAAWGSDAVAGVVNLIYDRSLEGLRLEAQAGQSTEGDAREYKVEFAFGSKFADDRGHFLAAVEWNDIPDRIAQEDRAWGRESWGVITNVANTGPADGRPALLISPNITLSGATFGGVITGPTLLADTAFGPGGTLLPFNRGPNPAGLIAIGGTNTISGAITTLQNPIERRSIVGSAEYKLTDRTSVFLDTLFSRSEVFNPIIPPFSFGNITIRNDNAYLPAALLTRMQANNITSFTMGRLHRELGYYTANNRRTVLSTALGVKGRFGDEDQYTWDVYYQFGESRTDTFQTGNFWVPNFNLAVDAVRNPANGQIVCRSALNINTVPAELRSIASACVPLNLFGEGSPSRAALDYVGAISSINRQQNQRVAGANISGDVVDLWAGPLSLAAGIENRSEELDQQTDSASVARLLSLSNNFPTNGEYDVTDVYLEAVLPLLTDKPFARSLELNVGARESDYSTVGRVTTWKGGLTWTPVEGLLFRASQSRDIRAPNASELFAPGVRATFSPRDPCAAATQAQNPAIRANCAAQGIPANFTPGSSSVEASQVGNLNLGVETSTTRTAGVVWSPGFANLQISADWYQIELTEAIGLLAPQTLLDACYTAGVATACNTVFRDPTTRAITGVRREFINVGSIDMEGVDAQLRWSPDLGGSGRFADQKLSIGVLGSYVWDRSESVNGFQTFQLAGQVDPTPQAIGTGVPKLRANLTADWEIGNFGVRPRVRYLSAAKFNNAYGPEDININSVKSMTYVDLTLDYRADWLGTNSVLYVGGSNLTDKDPPIAPNAQFFPQTSNYRLYDVIGRTVFAGVRISF